MLNSEFEKAVQQKMEELNIAPSEKVWVNIAHQLPAPNKRRRWIVFFFLFALILGSGIYSWFTYHDSTGKNSGSNPIPVTPLQDTDDQVTHRIPSGKDTGLSKKLSVITLGTAANANVRIITQKVTSSATKEVFSPEQITTGNARAVPDKRPQDYVVTKTTVNTSAPGSEEINITAKVPVNTPVEITAAGLPDSVLHGEKTLPEKTAITDMTTDVGKTKKAHPVNYNKKKSGWETGVSIGVGISSVKTGLFGNTKVFADVQGGLSSGSGTPLAQPGVAPSAPRPGFSSEGGVYFNKKLNSHLKFHTGINFAFRSSRLQIGTRTDSVTAVTFGRSNFQANSYYRTGDNSTYKNRFYLLEVPLALQYEISEKFPLFVSGGASLGYLIHSNALVYDEIRAIYATDHDVLNKFLISAVLGAGVDISKLKLPVRLGYKMSYTLGSVTKPAFGKQHLLTSSIYLEMPLKK